MSPVGWIQIALYFVLLVALASPALAGPVRCLTYEALT